MANPPSPLAPNADPLTFGYILHYGLQDLAVTGIIIDSYKRNSMYADTNEITGQDGVVRGVRMSDGRAQVSFEGRVLLNTPYTVKSGDKLQINGDTILIKTVDYSGQAKGFHTLSCSGEAYSGIADLYPSGVTTGGTATG